MASYEIFLPTLAKISDALVDTSTIVFWALFLKLSKIVENPSLELKPNNPSPFFCIRTAEIVPIMVGRVPAVFTIKLTNSSILVSPLTTIFIESELIAVEINSWTLFCSYVVFASIESR